MAAFIVATGSLRATEYLCANQTSLSRSCLKKGFSVRRRTLPRSFICSMNSNEKESGTEQIMNSNDKENGAEERMISSETESGAEDKQSDATTSDEFNQDADEKLQKNAIYVYKEFGKVSAIAIMIGFVLFFYDMLISLWVTTIGLLYALAVLFEVKGADKLFSNMLKVALRLWGTFADGAQKAWTAIRTELRKSLKI